MPAQPDRLRAMMEPYASPKHSVVAFSLHDGETRFIKAGPPVCDAPCDNWVFEIGSITKVFTAILLCVLIEEGKVDPHAPLRDMSEVFAAAPPWITPERLVTHTSGLPRLHVPIWRLLFQPLPADPYAAISRADLAAWLRAWSGAPPGARPRHLYSNLGFGLLGEALALAAGRPYPDLLADKVLGPLGLTQMTARAASAPNPCFAQPKKTNGTPVVPWTFDAMAGAGCLRASARELAQFAARCLQAIASPNSVLDRAILRSTHPHLDLGQQANRQHLTQCYGWFAERVSPKAPRILHHNGGTAGSTCAIYLCPEKAQAVGILSNNGVVASLWAGSKLSCSNPVRRAQDIFVG